MNSICNKNQRSGALHITKKVDYAILLLLTLVQRKSEENLSIRKIAENKNLSFSFLQNVARQLQKSGLIKAARGKHGGYSTTKSAANIHLKEIIEALEGPIAIVPCLQAQSLKPCKNSATCEIKSGFARINTEIQNHLLSKTLAHFIN